MVSVMVSDEEFMDSPLIQDMKSTCTLSSSGGKFQGHKNGEAESCLFLSTRKEERNDNHLKPYNHDSTDSDSTTFSHLCKDV
ncbi:hypothetical protein Avbf_17168 [Armadillidium vulgare]|nr:hypothetical protein Avbf_17168 [Armadillidium vulgare]